MFVSQHDLLLGTILLLFASGIAVALGSFFSDALAARIQMLNQAVQEIRTQGFGTRVAVQGDDEIAELAMAFNHMAAQLEETERKREELDHLRRDLIAWVGHDLQTPLASIRAIVEALADEVVQDPETAHRYLQTAKREVQALSALIDDLFEMAQLDAGGIKLDLERSALSDLISDTLESFSALTADKGIMLSGEVDPDVDPVTMDMGRIGRVLNNLLSNSLRHTSAGGEIWVAARRCDGHVEVEVGDSGEGLASDELSHVFERFYRGEKSRSRRTGGAGLGLAIAKGFVEAHGGEIWVEQGEEEGARFIFTLPYHVGHQGVRGE
jgi:signal transduction histidine kinase